MDFVKNLHIMTAVFGSASSLQTLTSKAKQLAYPTVLEELSSNEGKILDSLALLKTESLAKEVKQDQGMHTQPYFAALSDLKQPTENLSNFLDQYALPQQSKAINDVKHATSMTKAKSAKSVHGSYHASERPIMSSRPAHKASSLHASSMPPVNSKVTTRNVISPENTCHPPVSSTSGVHRHTPRIRSVLNPSSPSRLSSPAPSHAPKREISLLKQVLLNGLRKTESRNVRPRTSTVLGERRKIHRPEPYSRAHQKRRMVALVSRAESPAPGSPTGSTAPPIAAHINNVQDTTAPSRLKKNTPRLPHLPRDVQENYLRATLRHVASTSYASPKGHSGKATGSMDHDIPADVPAPFPHSASLNPSPDTASTSTPSLAIGASPDQDSLAKNSNKVPGEEQSAAIAEPHDTVHPNESKSDNEESTTLVIVKPTTEVTSSTPTPEQPAIPADVIVEHEDARHTLLSEDEGTDVGYDHGSAFGADAAMQEPPAPPPEAPARPSWAEDEGYEGSDTSDAEVDELDEENESTKNNTHQIPRYRQPHIPRNMPAAPSAPPPLTPRVAPKKPVDHLFLDPKKRKLDVLGTATGGPAKRPRQNWALAKRKLGPAPELSVGWDKTKRASKNSQRSRAFYNDSAAKRVQAPSGYSSPQKAALATWMQTVHNWLEVGNALFNFNGEHASAEVVKGLRKVYDRNLSAALRTDDGIEVGVKNAKITTLSELGFVPFLLAAREYFVDERWGKDAIELRGRIEVYLGMVRGRW